MPELIVPKGFTRPQLEAALARCEEISSKDKSNLWVVSQFLEDRPRREAFSAMYAVMRSIDDFVDGVHDRWLLPAAQRAELHAELGRWLELIQHAYRKMPRPGDPLELALASAVDTFRVPFRIWARFIDAMRIDVDEGRFATRAAFVHYTQGASVAPTWIYLHLLAAELHENGRYHPGERDCEAAATDLGLMAYVAHILRDVVEDLGIGQHGLVYVSAEDLAQVGLSEAALREHATRRDGSREWSRLVETLAGWARPLGARGAAAVAPWLAELPRDRAFVMNLIVTLYRELLERICADPAVVFRGAPVLGEHERAMLAHRCAAEVGFELRGSPGNRAEATG